MQPIIVNEEERLLIKNLRLLTTDHKRAIILAVQSLAAGAIEAAPTFAENVVRFPVPLA